MPFRCAVIFMGIELVGNRLSVRLFKKDPTLWSEQNFTASDNLEFAGWTDSCERAMSVLSQPEIINHSRNIMAKFRTIVIVGIGGANQALEAYGAISDPQESQHFQILNSTHPDSVKRIVKLSKSGSVHFVVASKSGGTTETFDLARTIYAGANLNPASDYFTVVTNPEPSPLMRWAQQNEVKIIEADPVVPGRFSALSILNLASGMMIGLPLGSAFQAYQNYLKSVHSSDGKHDSLICELAAVLAKHCETKCSRLVLSVSRNHSPLARWLEQLIAESLGKENLGVLPVIQANNTESDKFSVSAGESDANAVEIYSQKISGTEDLVRFFLDWQTIVTLAAWQLGINPVNQPDVENSKRRAVECLENFSKPEFVALQNKFILLNGDSLQASTLGNSLKSLVQFGKKFGYISILAYIDPTSDNEELLNILAVAVQSKTSMPVVYHFGPQYLHSVGQFHKGGPTGGRFLIILDAPDDVMVADEPYGLHQSMMVQATADIEELRHRSNHVHAVKLTGNTATGLQRLTELFA